jgi:hypothetical protein
MPFSVFTVSEKQPRDGWIAGLYDFDWCERDQSLYYHCSGGGGSFYVNRICEPRKSPRCAAWFDSALVLPTNGGSLSKRPLSLKTLDRFGYDLLKSPLAILGDTNPFSEAYEDSVEY